MSPQLKGQPVDYPSLAGFDLGKLRDAVDQWTDIQNQFKQAIADYEKSVQNPLNGDGWSGDAATKAKQSITDTHAKLVATEQYLDGVVAVLRVAADGIGKAQDMCKRGAGSATGGGHTLDPATGNITKINGAAGNWDAPAILAATDNQLTIYQARLTAFAVGAEVSPVLGLASQFGQADSGPWQANAAANLQTAQSTASALPGLLNAIDSSPAKAPPDTAAQPYKVDSPGSEDHTLKAAFYSLALPYFKVYEGWTNAADLLDDWLGNSGNAAGVDPAKMLSAMPHFLNAAVPQQIDGVGVTDSGWLNYDPSAYGGIESEDWYYAFNDFRFRMLGMQMIDNSGNKQMEFTISVKKPYVFGPPRNPIPVPLLSKIMPGAKVSQQSIEHLHTSGVAQNFIAEGITHLTHNAK